MDNNNKNCKTENNNADNIQHVILIGANGQRFAEQYSFDQSFFLDILAYLVFIQRSLKDRIP